MALLSGEASVRPGCFDGVMEQSSGSLRTGAALVELGRVLDLVESDRSYAEPAEALGWVRAARRVRSRVEALTNLLTAEADRSQAAETSLGTPLASWLGMGETVSRREAAGAIRQARELGAHQLLAGAAVAGQVSTRQVRSISGVLDGLADRLDAAQRKRAEQVLLDLAGHLDAEQLARSAGEVLATVAPAAADELLEQRLQREAERAHRQRSLRFFHEGASVRFDGSLPRVEAESWISQLTTQQEASRRTAIESRDPLAVTLTPEQRRADALISLIRRGGGSGGGSGATVQVTLDFDQLAAGASGAGRLPDGQPLSAGELRRICCDAAIIPVVLDSESAVLDVGRVARLVTPELRAALVARDGGCVFPGCDGPSSATEAHHVQPWWAGGATALSNLALLCHTHHALIEPARHGTRDQWQLSIGPDGLPEFLPPARLDPTRTPIRHRRHRSRGDTRAGPPHAA